MPVDRFPESTFGPIRHEGPCGRRRFCYRSECRVAFGPHPTIEVVEGRVVAYCHRTVTPIDPIILGMLDAAA